MPIDHAARRLCLLATLLLPGVAARAADAPDLILSGGEIRTPTGWAAAIAIRRGVIVAAGDAAAIDRLAGAATETIRLAGATVLPGLHDMHVHPLGAGMMQQQCLFPQGSNSTAILAAVRACAARLPAGEWIVGGQWDLASFGAQAMDRALLDAAAPAHPVSLVDISGHSIWVNSRALALAGIGEATAAPPGGAIERRADGEPTGVLRESAAGLVRRLVPPATPGQTQAALHWAMQTMLAHGITSYTDAGVDGAGLAAYAALADAGELKQRIRACLMLRRGAFGGGNAGTPDYVQARNLYARERFSPSCVKLALDGVPTDSHTAAMVEPYADRAAHGPGRERGMLMVPQEELNAIVIAADAQGLTVKMHAAGDGAVRAGLNAIAAARAANGFSGLLHDVAHNSFVHMDDVARARGIGATFEMSPYIWYPNPIIPDIAAAVGEERMQRWIPVKDAIESGALVVAGSDWPVVPLVDPWLALETLVTRQQPGGGGPVLGAAERITLEQAFDLFTVNAARQMGHAHRAGSLAPGMLADLVVVDRNPFRIPITEVHQTKVQLTLIEGEVVYRAGEPAP